MARRDFVDGIKNSDQLTLNRKIVLDPMESHQPLKATEDLDAAEKRSREDTRQREVRDSSVRRIRPPLLAWRMEEKMNLSLGMQAASRR